MNVASSFAASSPVSRARGWAWLGCLLPVLLAGPASAAEWSDDFALPPEQRGWRAFGDDTLFAWDADREAVRVTWDSARPNSYLQRPLGTVLSRTDDFAFGFDLELEAVAAGVSPDKPFTFELAVGLHRRVDAEQPDFRRGTGVDSPNLVEFVWFPDTGRGATVWPTIVAANGRFNYSGSTDFTLLDLAPGHRFTVWMSYDAASATLATSMWRDGAPFGPVRPVKLAPSFTDFRVDTFAVRSYSDAGADGSLRATGWIDNVRLVLPPPPLGAIRGVRTDGQWRVSFEARGGWSYTLERTEVLGRPWQVVGAATPGSDGDLQLTDPAPPATAAFYRVRAEKP